jgi:DNA invertase Pin-like site-specific DNA recombinase
LKAYCTARKFAIFREYIESGESGAKDSRPRLNELMADARKRKFDAILVWRFDRFARSTKHLLLALKEFRSLGFSSSASKRTLTRAALWGRRSSQSFQGLPNLSVI